MSIFAISDLHLSFSSDKPMDIFGVMWENHFEQIVYDWKLKVKDEDTVLLAGDLSWAMTMENALIDIAEVEKLPGKKIIIRGNHDYWWHSYTKLFNLLKNKKIYAIQNNAINVDGVIYCGSRGWTLPDSNKTEEDETIYKRELIRIELSLSNAKKMQTDNEPIIVLMHYPPFEIGNGDTDFTKLFEKYEVSKVVYGHLHGRQGRTDIHTQKNNIDYYLTSCDKLGNRLIKL